MKTTILSLCMAFAIALNAQFIPQQMGYNPDVNGDELIGVEDLMGTLSLYGNSFDNGDSLIVQTINYPDDYGLYSNNYGASTYLDDSWDIVYLNQAEDEGVSVYLSEGVGYKVLQVFVDCDGFTQMNLWFLPPNASPTIFGGPINLNCNSPRVFTFIRGHNGIWYSQDTDNY